MIYELPSVPIAKQMFHVPGAAVEGGFTSGGARIISPDPGGFSRLQIQLSLQSREWENPVSSWLASKANGQVIRLRLAPTPQIAYSQRRAGYQSVSWQNGVLWSNLVSWAGDVSLVFTSARLQGSNVVTVDTTATGPIFQAGHVIGHSNTTYLIDAITYAGAIATIVVNPSLRKPVAIGDTCYLRPYFVGRIANPNEFITTYDAENNGAIQLGIIMFNEAFVGE